MVDLSRLSKQEAKEYLAMYESGHLCRHIGRTEMGITQCESRPLSELLAVLAKNIEQAMLLVGATPGKDYTFRDLFELATPYALEIFKTDNKVNFDSEHF
jgi:hypothetical protein